MFSISNRWFVSEVFQSISQLPEPRVTFRTPVSVRQQVCVATIQPRHALQPTSQEYG
jgi:hypothetical protein